MKADSSTTLLNELELAILTVAEVPDTGTLITTRDCKTYLDYHMIRTSVDNHDTGCDAGCHTNITPLEGLMTSETIGPTSLLFVAEWYKGPSVEVSESHLAYITFGDRKFDAVKECAVVTGYHNDTDSAPVYNDDTVSVVHNATNVVDLSRV